jgi:hypothetical protein
MLTVVPKLYDGTLDWAAIWSQQLEHRSVTTKLVSLFLARTTHLNLVDEMYLGFAFDFLALLLIWNMLAISLKDERRALIGPLTIVASLLLCWPVTWEIWTWGIASFQYFSAPFWAVLMVWALTRWPGRWKGVAVASITTVIAIYTTGHGFALIPVGVVAMLASGIADGRMRWAQLCVFLLAGIGCVVVYLKDYISPAHHPPNELTGVTGFHLVRYFLTYLGAPFWTTKAQLSPYFGLLGICILSSGALYIMRSMRDRISSAMPWLLLISYVLVNAAITAVARIHFGVYQAASSRYNAIVILFWISITVIVSIVATRVGVRFKRPTWMVPLTAFIVISMASYAYLYYKGLQLIRMRNAIFIQVLPYVLNYEQAPDYQLQVFHPYAQAVRGLSRRLEQYQLGPFAARRTERPGID